MISGRRVSLHAWTLCAGLTASLTSIDAGASNRQIFKSPTVKRVDNHISLGGTKIPRLDVVPRARDPYQELVIERCFPPHTDYESHHVINAMLKNGVGREGALPEIVIVGNTLQNDKHSASMLMPIMASQPGGLGPKGKDNRVLLMGSMGDEIRPAATTDVWQLALSKGSDLLDRVWVFGGQPKPNVVTWMMGHDNILEAVDLLDRSDMFGKFSKWKKKLGLVGASQSTLNVMAAAKSISKVNPQAIDKTIAVGGPIAENANNEGGVMDVPPISDPWVALHGKQSPNDFYTRGAGEQAKRGLLTLKRSEINRILREKLGTDLWNLKKDTLTAAVYSTLFDANGNLNEYKHRPFYFEQLQKMMALNRKGHFDGLVNAPQFSAKNSQAYSLGDLVYYMINPGKTEPVPSLVVTEQDHKLVSKGGYAVDLVLQLMNPH